MTSQFTNMTPSSNFLDVALFLYSSAVTCLGFMPISLLVLELWPFSFKRDWPEIRKSETPPSEFYPITRDWKKLGIQNLARMPLMKWQGSSFYCFLVIKGKLTEEGGINSPSSSQIRVNSNDPIRVRWYSHGGIKMYFMRFLLWISSCEFLKSGSFLTFHWYIFCVPLLFFKLDRGEESFHTSCQDLRL